LQDFNELKLTAENLAGEAIVTKVNVSINSLQLPDRLIRKRYWDRPDAFVMSKEEYIKYFPYDEYDNETDRNEWKNKNSNDELRIMNYELTESQSKFPIPNTKFQQGIFKITATTIDKDGQEVKAISYIELYDKAKQELSYPQYKVEQNKKTECKVGDTAIVGFATAAKDIYIVKNIVNNSTKQKEESTQNHYTILQINNNAEFKQLITETNTQGIGIYYAFIKNNRFYEGGSNINIIEPSKKLKISYGTYRNKTLPGSKETYSLKISGENGEKVAAELLTAMYDASLDEYKLHKWDEPYLRSDRGTANGFSSETTEAKTSQSNGNNFEFEIESTTFKYNSLCEDIFALSDYFGLRSKVKFGNYLWKGNGSSRTMNEVRRFETSVVSDLDGNSNSFLQSKMEVSKFAPPKIVKDEEVVDSARVTEKYDSKPQINNEKKQIQIRKNFNETAFFFPNLYADTAGNYTFSFTMPEALTKWKWQSFAHTKNLSFGVSTATVVTQKTLMVQPNAPRFLREGDVMEFTAKISNTSDKELTGTATLELIDATTNISVDGWFNNVFPLQYFTVAANQSSVVKFPIQVPMGFTKPLTYRIVAVSKFPSLGGAGVVNNDEASDGEENTLLVLTNKIFLTESLPIYLKSSEQQKIIDLKPLFNTASNRIGESVTIEYTSNPIWTVVQALPYLMEYPYEYAEQTFNRFFANAMASNIINKNDNIKTIIEKWKADTSSIKSKLQTNEALKSLLLAETPWLLDAESEVEQQKRLALLLDLDKMQSNINGTIENLKSKQLSNGAFSWFDGGRENDYITQYIVTGIGKLKLIDALNKDQQKLLNVIAAKALKYLDSRMEADYKRYIANLKNSKNKVVFWGNSLDINYWNMRSMFIDIALSPTLLKAQKLFIDNAAKNWTTESIYMQGMIAMTLNRFNNKNTLTKRILASVKENAIEDTAKGTMYWKQNQYYYYWYQNNFETQALLIQAFAEINNSDKDIDKMKTWLILNKQTNKWNSTVSTSAACYAILNYGSNWSRNQQSTTIQFGNKTIQSTSNNQDYIQQRFDGKEFAEMPKDIIITNKPISQLTNKPINNSPSYGAVYYQYFADVNDVKSSTDKAPLTLVKKLFIEKNNGTKKVLEPVSDNDELNIGDKLIVRIELRADRPMEFLHLKDMRAASTEPVNVLSQYKWQDGLGYYESTKDASTNFFIDNVQRGTYVFDYPLYITHSGTFSVGLASIQCMYAPEFTSHSEGIRIRVK
jgi:hypothetical protein